jgi:hypothetical protein
LAAFLRARGGEMGWGEGGRLERVVGTQGCAAGWVGCVRCGAWGGLWK